MGEECTKIRLDGDCGVERAAELKEQLQAALSGEVDCVELDLSAVTRADVSLQQLICSAHRSFSRQGKRVVLTELPSKAFRQMQQSGGFGRVCMFRREHCPFQGGNAHE